MHRRLFKLTARHTSANQGKKKGNANEITNTYKSNKIPKRSYQKFRDALIESRDKKLVETVKSDRFWSCGLTPLEAQNNKTSVLLRGKSSMPATITNHAEI